jgi:TIR domain/SIR2-like domain
MTVPNDKINWELIIKRIEDEHCILIIGPEISIIDQNKPINELLRDRIENESEGQVNFSDGENDFYSDDEFFHFADESLEAIALWAIQSFYDELQPNEIHKKIAEIPFHLILSVSPDLIMKKLFENTKLDFTFDYYSKQQNPLPLEKPTAKKPLLYNLFGNIEQADSVILTYTELFDYIISISGKDDMPQEIKSQIYNSTLILFLGFRFEKWYFKLLLRLLKIQAGKTVKHAGIKGSEILQQVRNFYSEEFKINFLDLSSIDVLNNIHSRFKAKNKLRLPSGQDKTGKPEIFLSYGWGGESEAAANNIYSSLVEKGFNIIRDKIDLGYLGNIRQFMQTIGKGKYVVMIISDKYLRSENCMFEILEIKNNGSIYNRIFPIVLSDAKIYDEIERIDYINYWDEKVKELNEKAKTIQNLTGTNNVIGKLNQFADIRRVFDEITDMLRNMNTLSPAIHNNTNFEALTKALDERIHAENSN